MYNRSCGKLLTDLNKYKMDLKEFVRQNEKMNSSLITDWSKEMLLEAMQIYADEQLRLYRVSNRRELLEAFAKQIKEDNELTEEINFQDINKFLASNCC